MGQGGGVWKIKFYIKCHVLISVFSYGKIKKRKRCMDGS